MADLELYSKYLEKEKELQKILEELRELRNTYLNTSFFKEEETILVTTKDGKKFKCIINFIDFDDINANSKDEPRVYYDLAKLRSNGTISNEYVDNDIIKNSILSKIN